MKGFEDMPQHPKITRETISRRLSQRVNATKIITEHLGPKSLTDLAHATGVNRQTITNAMNATGASADSGPGRPPSARIKLAEAIDEVLPNMDVHLLAVRLRELASQLENGALCRSLE